MVDRKPPLVRVKLADTNRVFIQSHVSAGSGGIPGKGDGASLVVIHVRCHLWRPAVIDALEWPHAGVVCWVVLFAG